MKTPAARNIAMMLASETERAYARTKSQVASRKRQAMSARSLIRLTDAGILSVTEACERVGYGVDPTWLRRRFCEGHRSIEKLRQLAARGAS